LAITVTLPEVERLRKLRAVKCGQCYIHRPRLSADPGCARGSAYGKKSNDNNGNNGNNDDDDDDDNNSNSNNINMF
jgi:hypothetical protein